jgi:hypothetical protein
VNQADLNHHMRYAHADQRNQEVSFDRSPATFIILMPSLSLFFFFFHPAEGVNL